MGNELKAVVGLLVSVMAIYFLMNFLSLNTPVEVEEEFGTGGNLEIGLFEGRTVSALSMLYMKACILPNYAVVADPTGTMVSYEGGYVVRVLVLKNELALAKAVLNEFVKNQKDDGSWSQQYRPERTASGLHVEVEDRQVDSGASSLISAMSAYDGAVSNVSVVYKESVRKAFNFLREAQYAHIVAYSSNLLANQRLNGSWNTGALLADCAEALLATTDALNQYGTNLTSQAGYSVKTFGRDLYYSMGIAGWGSGGADGYYRTEYPASTIILELPKVAQGISYTQALCAWSIKKWYSSAHKDPAGPNYVYQCEKALDWITALGMGKWGGFYFSPFGGMYLHESNQTEEICAEYPCFTALMVLAYKAVNETKYARQIERGINFIRLCSLPTGEVYNLVRINSVLGETRDVENHYHFRVYNSALGLLAGA